MQNYFKNLLKKQSINFLAMPAVSLIARPIYSGMGVIFTLHRVVVKPEDTLIPGVSITVDFLEKILKYLKSQELDVISLSEAVKRIESKEMRNRFVCFTFDDGYTETLTLASPLFKKYSMPYTVFLVSSFIEGDQSSHWGALEEFLLNSDQVYLPCRSYPEPLSTVTQEEKLKVFFNFQLECWRNKSFAANLPILLKEQGFDVLTATRKQFLETEGVHALSLDPFCEFGSHTLTHKSLTSLSPDEMYQELFESRKKLSALLKRDIRLMAYPFGSKGECGAREFEAAKRAGYIAAVTTRSGNIHDSHKSNLMALPRVGLSLLPHAHNINFIKASISGARNALVNNGKRVITI